LISPKLLAERTFDLKQNIRFSTRGLYFIGEIALEPLILLTGTLVGALRRPQTLAAIVPQ
jgi:hypothetical protein